MYISVHI